MQEVWIGSQCRWHSPAEGQWAPGHHFPLLSRPQSPRSVCWKSWEGSCLSTGSKLCTVCSSRPTAQHTKTGQEGNTLLYSQTKPALSTNLKCISFPFSFWEKRPHLIVSPIWCTFTVRKNEFSFPYMCQIMTSGRKKNLHFQKPHASSHWLCHAQHETPKPTRVQYKLFTGYTFQRDKYKYYKMNGITFKIHVFV